MGKNDKRSILLIFVLLIVFLESDAWCVCLTCAPQCVAYARNRSGIGCYGDAGIWSSCSAAKKTDIPKKGYVIILKSPAHAIYIEKADKKSSTKYSLRISHTNFTTNCDYATCSSDINMKADYNTNKHQLTINEGRGSGKTYNVSCILKKK